MCIFKKEKPFKKGNTHMLSHTHIFKLVEPFYLMDTRQLPLMSYKDHGISKSIMKL